MTEDPRVDPRLLAGVQLLQRTGAQTFRVAFSPEDDGPPIAWTAVAQWTGGRAEAAAAMEPVLAVLRLCERVIDGGECAHCHRVTMFEAEVGWTETPFDPLFCQYAWDPELATFRRSCEGDVP